jgi:anti-sigma factor RsiW
MDCLDYKDQLTDAALESLVHGEAAHCEGARWRAGDTEELNAHLARCAACAAEFARVRLLLSAIDHSLEASVRAEPSPEMMARFRRRIAEEPAPQPGIGMWTPVAAAALAVAVAAFLWLGIRPGPRHIAPASSREFVAKSTRAQPPRRVEASAASANVAPPVASRPGASHALKPAGRLDVLVPPGQMAAALQLQAAMRNGRVDPSSIVAGADKAELGEPLDIASLKIPPLEFPKLDAGEEDAKDSVNR